MADRWMVEMKEKKYYYVAEDDDGSGGGGGAHIALGIEICLLPCLYDVTVRVRVLLLFLGNREGGEREERKKMKRKREPLYFPLCGHSCTEKE